MSKVKVNLANPVTNTANMAAKLFQGDKNIAKTVFDYKKRVLRVYVKPAAKAQCLATLFASRIELGKEHLDLAFYPGNEKVKMNAKLLLKDFGADKAKPEDKYRKLVNGALAGNAYFGKCVVQEDKFGTTWTFLCMKDKTVSWDNDDCSNPWGVTTDTAEHVMKKLKSDTIGAAVQITTFTPKVYKKEK